MAADSKKKKKEVRGENPLLPSKKNLVLYTLPEQVVVSVLAIPVAVS